MKRTILFLIVGLLSISLFGQEDATLKQMRAIAEYLRTAKGNVEKHKQAVKDLSADKLECITLMDDLKPDSKNNEDHSVNADPFRFNSVIGYVYKIKQGVNVSKMEFYDSREKGIHYSAIEKTIKGGKTITYKLTEHSGKQEFVIVPFDVKANYVVTINDTKVDKLDSANNYLVYSLPSVRSNQEILIKIQNKSPKSQSFVIMNYNEQK